MTQYVVQFIFTSAERSAVKNALAAEFPHIERDAISNHVENLYQVFEEPDSELCKLPAHEARSLLDRLLVACPQIAVACGLYHESSVEKYPSWNGLDNQELITACTKILDGLGYAYPR